MSVWNLSTCPICGRPHDDGTYIKIRKYTYFVCLDCSDSMTVKEIASIITKKGVANGKNPGRKKKACRV